MFSSLVLLLLALTPHQARQRPLGSTIALEGTVTVPSGVFGSFMNDNGFVLSDPLSGIYVTTENRAYRSLGSSLRVIGTLVDNGHGMLVLRAVSITSQKGHRLIAPWPVSGPRLDEFYEGKIVQTEGEVIRTESDLPAGHKLFLRRASSGPGPEMQVFLPPSVQVDPALLSAGRRIQVTGFCAQYNQTYEIVVRSHRDLKAR